MPQVDLETLVSACAGGNSHDRKIACEESLPDGENPPLDESEQPPEIPSDLPPESFWLSKDAEFDWLDQNAFYERKDSTKGSSNSTNLNPNINPATTNSNSQRFSLNFKSKASILGLPKLHKTCFADIKKNRRNSVSGNTRLFPKQSESSGKEDPSSLIEPSSPKVSCMGRVRSKRDRNRRRSSEPPPPPPKNRKSDMKTAKNGFLASFRTFFKRWRKQPPVDNSSSSPPPAAAAEINTTISVKPRKSVEMESMGLGGMKRFASGRRPGSWVAGVDVAD